MIARLLSKREKAERAFFAVPPVEREVAADRVHLISCIGVDLEYSLLPHFLDHYLSLGIPAENCHLVLNSAVEDSRELQWAVDTLAARGVTAEEVWCGGYTSARMWQKRRDVQRRCVPKDHWVISADADEFHEYPASLFSFLAECEANNVNCVDGVFIDRIAEDGRLREFEGDRSPWQTFPLSGMVQGYIASFGTYHRPFGSVKLMAFDAGLLPDKGGHGLVPGQSDARYLFGRHLPEYPQIRFPWFRFRVPLRVHHFKWHAGLVETLKRRVASPNVSPAGLEYGEKLLAYFSRNDGIALDDISLKKRAGDGELFWRQRVRALRALHFARRTSSRLKRRLV